MRRRLSDQRQALQLREQRLARSHPGAVLRQHAQRLDELEGRLRLALRVRLQRDRARADAARTLLLRGSPALRVVALRLRLDAARRGLAGAARARAAGARQRFELAARTLHAVSPLATLDRGYAIVTAPEGGVLREAARLRPGDRVSARLAHGGFSAEILEVKDGRDPAAEPT
jgi:exodeoxyribonuclease VII large subunit